MRRIGGGLGGGLLLVWVVQAAIADPTDTGPRRPRTLGSATMNAALNQPDRVVGSRRREGSQLSDELGTFKSTGDRITFYPDGGSEPFCVLENLTLERVWRSLSESQGRQWRVSGAVTEYRGANFLLITRAVLTSENSAPPHPG